MKEINYEDIYIKTFLNEIKSKIKLRYVKLSGDKEQETDKKMVEVIRNIYSSGCNSDMQDESFLKTLMSISDEVNGRIFCTLMLYYVDLYNDSVDFLNELLEKGYNFGRKRTELNLFILDKRFISRFEKELYIDLITKQERLFGNFYSSLKYSEFETSLSDDEIIDIFCSILNKNPRVAYIEKEYSIVWGNHLNELLTKDSIVAFGEDIILNATDKQKCNIINKLNFSKIALTEKQLNRLVNLVKNHNFSVGIYGRWSNVLDNFTDEELIKVNEYEYNLLEKYYDIDTEKFNLEKIRKKINSKSNLGNNVKRKVLSIFKR